MINNLPSFLFLLSILLVVYFLRLEVGLSFSLGNKSNARFIDGTANRYLVLALHTMSLSVISECLRRVVFLGEIYGSQMNDYYQVIYWLVLFSLVQVRKSRPEPSRVLVFSGMAVSLLGIVAGWAFWFPS